MKISISCLVSTHLIALCHAHAHIFPTSTSTISQTWDSNFWYTVPTTIEGPPTLPDSLRTYPNSRGFDSHPWMAPGRAPVANPCGVLRFGEQSGITGTEALKQDLNLTDSRSASPFPSSPLPVWRAGGTAEVGFTFIANHGGGYSYRICPLERLRDGTLDEACFQRNPLTYADHDDGLPPNANANASGKPKHSTSWLQVGAVDAIGQPGTASASGDRIAFTAERETVANNDGTEAVWTKMPIPACGADEGEGGAGWDTGGNGKRENRTAPSTNSCAAPQFEPAPELAAVGVWGYGVGPRGNSRNSAAFAAVLGTGERPGFAVVDRVSVPGVGDLEAVGPHVVSWRWDTEQDDEVWTYCTVVDIRLPSAPVGDAADNRVMKTPTNEQVQPAVRQRTRSLRGSGATS